MAIMEGMHRLERLELTLSDKQWPFAEQNRSAIDAHWAGLSKANPDIRNGDILMA